MAVCDANYIRLLQLLPELGLNSRREIIVGSPSPQPGLITLIEVTEQFRYTATVRISQLSVPDWQDYQAPEMLVRVYHDARTAEVVSYQQHRYFRAMYPLPNRQMYQADEKEQLNFFLAEWLGVCQKEGLYPQDMLAEQLKACLATD